MWKIATERANYAVGHRFRKAVLCIKAGDKAVFHTTYSQFSPKMVFLVSCFGMDSWLVNIICI
jgi:hypothetical protein